MKINFQNTRAYRRLTWEQKSRIEVNLAYLASQCQRINVSPDRLKRAPFVRHGPVPLQDMTTAEIDNALVDALSAADARASVRSTIAAPPECALPAGITEESFSSLASFLHATGRTPNELLQRVQEGERQVERHRTALERALQDLMVSRDLFARYQLRIVGADEYGISLRAGIIAASQDPMWELLALTGQERNARLVFGTREPLSMVDPGSGLAYQLGHWSLHLNLSNAELSFMPLRSSATERGNRHPHVLTSKLCYGEATPDVALVLTQIRAGAYGTALPELLRLVNRVFWTYNSASPYTRLPSCPTTPEAAFVFARPETTAEPAAPDELGGEDPNLDEGPEPEPAATRGESSSEGTDDPRLLAQFLLSVCRAPPGRHPIPSELPGLARLLAEASSVTYADFGVTVEEARDVTVEEACDSPGVQVISARLEAATFGCVSVAPESPCFYTPPSVDRTLFFYDEPLSVNFNLNFSFEETDELRAAAGED